MMARTFLLSALLLGAAFAGLAGNASAQLPAGDAQGQISCNPGPSEIRPLGTPGEWQCEVTVQFPSQAGDPANFFTVNLQDANSPSWANVIIAPASVIIQYQPGSSVTEEFSVSVALTQNAPAFEATKVTIDGTPGGGSPQGLSISPTQLTVTPGYFNLYNVRLEQKIGQGGPQDSVQYPIVIDNFSNGDTRFEFALLNPDNLPSGFQPVVPEPLVLNSRATGGEQTSGNVQFEVYTPFQNGYVNEIGSIQLSVDSMYAADTNIKGASSQISTLTQARGFYVPGPAAPLMILGMLGAALVLTRTDPLERFGEEE